MAQRTPSDVLESLKTELYLTQGMGFDFREHQEDAINAYINNRFGLFDITCGCGKTLIQASIIVLEIQKCIEQKKQFKGLWVCHRLMLEAQVKYRFEKDVKWNDQITKALALTDERVRKLYQANQLTDQDWCIWGKQIQRRAVLVTTTKLSDSVTNAIGTDAFDVIDETVLLEYIGKKNNVNPNKEFWETLFERIYK